MGAIHVLIADDSREFRRQARALLERQEDIEVVAEAADGRAAVEETGLRRPEVVLMDIELPVLDGIRATREIRARWPEVQVVPLTIWDRPVFREAMAEAGAVGYVVKDGEPGELIRAIRRAVGAERPVPVCR